jgi:anti-sigma factor RsiW
MTDHLEEHLLHDVADEAIADADRPAIEAHLAACPACTQEVALLRTLHAGLADLPRDIPPPAHVRAAVQAAIAVPGAATLATQRAVRRQSAAHTRPHVLAAAAVVLIAASSAVTALVLRRPPAAPPLPASDPAAIRHSPVRPEGPTPVVLVHDLERSYQSEITQLQRVLADAQAVLAPETRRILEQNLEIIDRALLEAREALAADPSNDVLAELLRAGYERKLDVLRSATAYSRVRS